jgi:hypothetical protein
MRLGIIISIILVALLAFLFVALSGGQVDPPTRATAPEKLKEFKMKAGLPKMWEVSSPDASATALYDKLFTTVHGNKRYADDNVPDALVETAMSQLIAASEAGQIANGWLDEKIPMEPSATPEFGDTLEVIYTLALKHATKLTSSEPSRAVRILRANFALGQRAFDNNKRLYPRRVGLDIMLETAGSLSQLSEQEASLNSELSAWQPELEKLRSVWNPKIELVLNLRSNIGDLLNIAEHDEDLSFKSEAVLVLGLRKFSPAGKKGNKTAIEEAIKRLQSDEEPLIAKAAKAAEAIKKEDIGKVR